MVKLRSTVKLLLSAEAVVSRTNLTRWEWPSFFTTSTFHAILVLHFFYRHNGVIIVSSCCKYVNLISHSKLRWSELLFECVNYHNDKFIRRFSLKTTRIYHTHIEWWKVQVAVWWGLVKNHEWKVIVISGWNGSEKHISTTLMFYTKYGVLSYVSILHWPMVFCYLPLDHVFLPPSIASNWINALRIC